MKEEFNRREFMSKSIAFVAGGATSYAIGRRTIPSYDISSKWKDANVGSVLEEEIEKKYDIELISEEEGDNIRKGLPNRKVKGHSGWSNRRINLLSEILQELPSHLYSRDEKGQKLMFEMTTSRVDFGGQCECNPTWGAREEVVRINRESFFDFESALMLTAHELVHRVTPYDLGIQAHSSPWYDQVDRVLSNGFVAEGERVYQKAQNILAQVKGKDQVPEMTEDIMSILYGFGYHPDSQDHARVYPAEFWPKISEYYIQGVSEFMRILGMLMDRDDLVRVYAFTKNEIFKGREYDKSPVDPK